MNSESQPVPALDSGAPINPGAEPWVHRGRDLDSVEEIREMVRRQYADLTQDQLLKQYFDLGPGFTDWKAHLATVADYWCHVLLGAPDYEVDTLENHRKLHERVAFTPELFDRWLEIFHDAVNGGWSGPSADRANKRATGMAWAMAQRYLCHGVWRPESRRT